MSGTIYGSTPVTINNGQNGAAGSAGNPLVTTPSASSQATVLPAGTDRSVSAPTTVGGVVLAAANTARRGLEMQNTGANNVWFTENGTDPVAGALGSYLILPNGTGRARTNRQVKVIAVTAATNVTATEW